MTAPSKQAFSAPGKALVAGGYLVLDPTYSAYVVALSARMHAVIQGSPSNNEKSKIVVNSPQFLKGSWTFESVLTGDLAFRAVPLTDNNPFLQAAITVLLSYIQPKSSHDIEIIIYSDDAYHSQDPEQLSKYPHKRFHNHSKPISEVPKTGLGSSAALVSVVTTALLSYFNPQATIDLQSKELLRRIHNLAQLAHCAAQKKVGSGFDVASAVCGSLTYRRFPASILGNLTSYEEYSGVEYGKLVNKLVDETNWGVSLEPCAMPKGLSLLMGDVCGGSETPKLVSTVLQWRKNQPDHSLQVWTDLNKANMKLVTLLDSLNKLSYSDPVAYAHLLDQAANSKSSELSGLLGGCVEAFKSIRKGLKIMTEETGAPIEPESQTKILDACYLLPGVVGGVVPGAGGYDAICLLVATSVVDKIKASTETNEVLKAVKWLELHEDNVGLQSEQLSIYEEYEKS